MNPRSLHTDSVPSHDLTPTAVESETFSCTAQAVWSYRLDFANLPDYNPDVSGVERVQDGDGVGGILGSGARYRFNLTDPRRPGSSQPVELWIVDVEEPVMVAAEMLGGNEAYEEFMVESHPDGCRATLSLWVTLPDGLDAATLQRATAGSRAQIRKELDLMKDVLEGREGRIGEGNVGGG